MNGGLQRMVGLVTGGLLLTGAAGCSSPVQTAAADVSPRHWERPAEIRLENADTVMLRDAALFLRCNDRFTEDTLTLRIATLSPDSLRFEEPFLLAVTRTNSPAALMHEYLVPYRRNLLLGREGEYRFVITPVRAVRGVEAVGIRFTKSH